MVSIGSMYIIIRIEKIDLHSPINKDRSELSPLVQGPLTPKVDVEVQQHFRSKLSSSHFWISILLIVYAYPHASILVIFIYYLSISSHLISSHLISSHLSIYLDKYSYNLRAGGGGRKVV